MRHQVIIPQFETFLLNGTTSMELERKLCHGIVIWTHISKKKLSLKDPDIFSEFRHLCHSITFCGTQFNGNWLLANIVGWLCGQKPCLSVLLSATPKVLTSQIGEFVNSTAITQSTALFEDI